MKKEIRSLPVALEVKAAGSSEKATLSGVSLQRAQQSCDIWGDEFQKSWPQDALTSTWRTAMLWPCGATTPGRCWGTPRTRR